MEKKDDYKFSELVFGLRGEYQKYENSLAVLKHFCQSEKNIGNGFRFFVHQLDGRSPELHCSYVEKGNFVQQGISRVKNLVVGVPEGICKKDSNDYYYIEGFPRKFPVRVNASISFTRMADEVLDSLFVQKIKLEKANELGYIRSIDPKGILFLSFGNIRHFKFQGDYPNAPLDYSVLYDAYKDTILFTSFDKKLSLERIREIVGLEFSKEQLDSYHIDSIDSSEVSKKSIILDEFPLCDQVECAIFEDKEKIVLTKRIGKK